MKKIIILGASGMLGSMVLDYFAKSTGYEIIATTRDKKSQMAKKYPKVSWKILDAENGVLGDIAKGVDYTNWIINCIGIIKPYIHDDNPIEVERAIKVNSLFPHLLAKIVEKKKIKVIQIATDCVYSGVKGKYIEADIHDANDVYGKSKSLGEVYSPNVIHLRCSIIGPELKSHLSLLDWFLGQKKYVEVNGFKNHMWNGVTTLHFAKLCHGIIKNDIKINHTQHIIPKNAIAKSGLLKSFAKNFNRTDVKINPVNAPKIVDRTLATNNKELNVKIWNSAGYKLIPTIEKMIEELANYIKE